MTMKSGFFIGLLLVLGFNVGDTQTNTNTNKPASNIDRFNLDIDLKGYGAPPFIYFDSTESKYYLLFCADNKKLKLVVTDNDFKILWQKETGHEPIVFKYYRPAIVLNNKTRLTFLYKSNKNQLYGLVIGKSYNSLTPDKILLNLKDNEEFISILNDSGSHYAVGYESGKKLLNVYPVGDDGIIGEKKTVSLPFSEKYDYKEWFKNLLSIDNGQSIPLMFAAVERKAFLWNDQLTFTWINKAFSNKINYVHLLKLDLKTSQIKVEKWGLTDVEGSASDFVCRDKLFIFKNGDSGMSLLISDTDKPKEIIKSYSALDGPIWFRNSQMIREANETTEYYGLSDGSKEDTKASMKFIRKLDNRALAISVIEKDQDYEITMGGTIDSGGDNSVSSPYDGWNMTAKMIGRNISASQSSILFPRGPNNEIQNILENEPIYDETYQLYFKSLINKNTLENHKGVGLRLNKDIEKYFDKSILSSAWKLDNLAYFTINGKDYYSFVSQKHTLFSIAREH